MKPRYRSERKRDFKGTCLFINTTYLHNLQNAVSKKASDNYAKKPSSASTKNCFTLSSVGGLSENHWKPCNLLSSSCIFPPHLHRTTEKNVLKNSGSQWRNEHWPFSLCYKGNQEVWDILNTHQGPDFQESSGVSLKHHEACALANQVKEKKKRKKEALTPIVYHFL